MEEDKALLDSGNMTQQEFITKALREPGCIPGSSSFVMMNDVMRHDEGGRENGRKRSERP